MLVEKITIKYGSDGKSNLMELTQMVVILQEKINEIVEVINKYEDE